MNIHTFTLYTCNFHVGSKCKFIIVLSSRNCDYKQYNNVAYNQWYNSLGKEIFVIKQVHACGYFYYRHISWIVTWLSTMTVNVWLQKLNHTLNQEMGESLAKKLLYMYICWCFPGVRNVYLNVTHCDTIYMPHCYVD